MAHDIRGRNLELVHQLVDKQGSVDDVIDMLAASRFAVSRKMRREDLEVFPKLVEVHVGRREAARAMQEQQRLPAAEHLHLEREFSVEQFLSRVHFALRASV